MNPGIGQHATKLWIFYAIQNILYHTKKNIIAKYLVKYIILKNMCKRNNN